MTRRVASAILLVVWTTLIVGGAAAYTVVRSIMLETLDETIVQRVASLGEVGGGSVADARPMETAGDRYLIVDDRGQTVARMPIDAPALRAPQITDRVFTTLGDGQRMRTLTFQTAASSDDSAEPRRVRVVYSASAGAFDRTLDRLRWTLLISGAAAGLFAAVVAGKVARRALRPLRRATQVMREINVDRLDRRIEAAPLPVELRPVAVTINEMLAALEHSVAQRKQFVADASHELRTPIASLLTAIEVALSRPRAEAELRVTLQRCLSSVNVLRRLVEQMLDQVRGEHHGQEQPAVEVRVAACLEQAVAPSASLAEQRGVTIEQDCGADLRIKTHPHRLHSIVSNLVANAVHYNRPGGWVRVTAETAGDNLILTVSDNGIGIPATHQARVFEPFYRVSHSRDASAGNVGLGLFLVQTHVRELGGRIDLKSEDGQGTTLRVTLPRCVTTTQAGPGAMSSIAHAIPA